MQREKNRATGNHSQNRQRFTAKLRAPLTTKLLRSIRNTSPSYPHELDSEGMTSLHTTGSSTPCIPSQRDGATSRQCLALILMLEIEYSYERDGRGTFIVERLAIK